MFGLNAPSSRTVFLVYAFSYIKLFNFIVHAVFCLLKFLVKSQYSVQKASGWGWRDGEHWWFPLFWNSCWKTGPSPPLLRHLRESKGKDGFHLVYGLGSCAFLENMEWKTLAIWASNLHLVHIPEQKNRSNYSFEFCTWDMTKISYLQLYIYICLCVYVCILCVCHILLRALFNWLNLGFWKISALRNFSVLGY